MKGGWNRRRIIALAAAAVLLASPAGEAALTARLKVYFYQGDREVDLRPMADDIARAFGYRSSAQFFEDDHWLWSANSVVVAWHSVDTSFWDLTRAIGINNLGDFFTFLAIAAAGSAFGAGLPFLAAFFLPVAYGVAAAALYQAYGYLNAARTLFTLLANLPPEDRQLVGDGRLRLSTEEPFDKILIQFSAEAGDLLGWFRTDGFLTDAGEMWTRYDPGVRQRVPCGRDDPGAELAMKSEIYDWAEPERVRCPPPYGNATCGYRGGSRSGIGLVTVYPKKLPNGGHFLSFYAKETDCSRCLSALYSITLRVQRRCDRTRDRESCDRRLARFESCMAPTYSRIAQLKGEIRNLLQSGRGSAPDSVTARYQRALAVCWRAFGGGQPLCVTESPRRPPRCQSEDQQARQLHCEGRAESLMDGLCPAVDLGVWNQQTCDRARGLIDQVGRLESVAHQLWSREAALLYNGGPCECLHYANQ